MNTTAQKQSRQAISKWAGQKMTGAEIFIRALEAEGVEVVFGHPGGAVIKIYDAMDRLDPSFKHVLVRHEQGGAHAAEGYAKASGKVGTVLVTSGPGATNTVTGIADAYLDSVPIVVFTGQVPTNMIGNDAFQETDTIGVTRSITKHSFLVRDVEELAPTVKKAYHLARTGRPGPVVVDLPKDVQMAETAFDYPEKVAIRGYSVPDKSPEGQIDRTVKLIEEAERPLLYVGGGTVSGGAAEELTALARKTRIPVTTTLHGLGAFPETDEDLSLNMLGMHGTWCANQAVQNCDLLIAVGARFDDRVTGNVDAWAPHAKIVHMDIDPACVSKNVYVDCALVGHVKTVLQQLLPRVEAQDTKAWLEQIQDWKEECPLTYKTDGELRPQYVIEQLWEQTQGEAVVVTDVGQHQMWAAQHFKFVHPRTHITSGGLGTMGFSFPASVGAAFGAKEQDLPIVSISGDGGFMMNSQELSVAAKHGLPIKVAIINNTFLGMVRQWQELFHENRFSHTDLADTNPDFVKLAEAHHCVGLRAQTPEEAREVIKKAWSINDRPVVMEFQVPKEEMVFPMVPAGGASDDMITKRFDAEEMV